MSKDRQKNAIPRERRKEERRKGENKVLIEFLPADQSPPHKKNIFVLTEDISPGGMKIVSPVCPPLDTQVIIELSLPKSRRVIHARGRVKWVQRLFEEELFQVGIEFVRISPEDRIALLERTYQEKP